MTNAEKFKEIFKEFATEVWSFSEKDFLTWLNTEYVEPTTKNDLLIELNQSAYSQGYADGVRSVNICPYCGEYIGEEE